MIKKFSVPLYPATIFVLKVDKFIDCYRLAKIDNTIYSLGMEDEYADENYGALMFVHPEYDNKIYIAINEKTTPSMVAHECVHATNQIFKSSGVKLDIDNDEPYAYLLGWVFEKMEGLMK